MIESSTRTTCLAVLTALAVTGCSDNLSTSGVPDELTTDIGSTLRDEVEASVNAFTIGSVLAPVGTTQAASEASLVAAACVSPSSPADTDGDGVPDDATFIFTAPPCRFTGWRGGTLDIVGQIRVQDPVPATAGFGYETTMTGLRFRFTNADASTIYDVTRNGTRTLSGSTAGLLLTAELQIIRTFTGHPDAAVDKQWAVSYTPAGPLQINGALPSGGLDIAGTVDWIRGAEHFVITVTTPTPLHYNADCTDTVQRIDSGELHAAGTFDEREGYVRVRWTECGREPQLSFVPVE
jgi:hypothetical protein